MGEEEQLKKAVQVAKAFEKKMDSIGAHKNELKQPVRCGIIKV